MFFRLLTGLLLVALPTSLFTQPNDDLSIRSCLTDQLHEQNMHQDPAYEKAWRARQQRMLDRMQEQPGEKLFTDCPDPIVLPIAVHFQNVITGFDLSCLRQLAIDQVQILNDDFQGVNLDIDNWTNGSSSAFPGVSNGESCLQFCLATLNHPAGYDLNDGDVAVTVNRTSGNFAGDWAGYVNIYVRNIGALGFSPLGGDGDGDGVTVDNAAFGTGAGCAGFQPNSPFDLGRTVTHEIGHYLNLPHIWGGGCANDDGVADTPDQSSSYGGCPNVGAASCGSTDMHMNYMDYVNDACMYMLSAGQVDRMENYTLANLQNVLTNTSVIECGGAPTASIQFATGGEVVKLTEGTSNCAEAGSRTLQLPLLVSNPPEETATVNVAVASSGVAGQDFALLTPQITIPAGSTAEAYVLLTIYEDAVEEPGVEIQLSLSIAPGAAPGNLLLGDNASQLLVVEDDDQAPGFDDFAQQEANTFSGFAEHDFGPGTSIYFRDQNSGGLMMKLTNTGGFDFGCIRVEVDRAAGAPPGATPSSAPESALLTDKTFFIVPEFNSPTGTYDVELYYAEEEINGWLAATGEPLSNLRVVKSIGTIEFATTLEVLPATYSNPLGFYAFATTVTTGFSGFALGGQAQVLPVEWLGFSAAGGEKSVGLRWEVGAQTGNAGFEVLRSTEQTTGTFRALGWVEGAGTTTEPATYTFTDETAIPGTTYFYQLRQVDVDGAEDFSVIRAASLAATAANRITISPNPFTSRLYFTAASNEAGTYQVLLPDGRVLREGSFPAGFHQENISLGDAPAGIYFLRVRLGKSITLRKIMKCCQ